VTPILQHTLEEGLEGGPVDEGTVGAWGWDDGGGMGNTELESRIKMLTKIIDLIVNV